VGRLNGVELGVDMQRVLIRASLTWPLVNDRHNHDISHRPTENDRPLISRGVQKIEDQTNGKFIARSL